MRMGPIIRFIRDGGFTTTGDMMITGALVMVYPYGFMYLLFGGRQDVNSDLLGIYGHSTEYEPFLFQVVALEIGDLTHFLLDLTYRNADQRIFVLINLYARNILQDDLSSNDRLVVLVNRRADNVDLSTIWLHIHVGR